jgi:hypothetical protein
LEEDYNYSKENVASKLKDVEDVLKVDINNLRYTKREEIYNNLTKIKKAS